MWLPKCELHHMIFETSMPLCNSTPCVYIGSLFLSPFHTQKLDESDVYKGNSIGLPNYNWL
jgi:hypothetical protein